ncbi:MAG TPA: hypothetical protein VKP30_26935 [Polyangiaceae bacterium]|nr:hypothetical protein [Polyangiaceae bacterium]
MTATDRQNLAAAVNEVVHGRGTREPALGFAPRHWLACAAQSRPLALTSLVKSLAAFGAPAWDGCAAAAQLISSGFHREPVAAWYRRGVTVLSANDILTGEASALF